MSDGKRKETEFLNLGRAILAVNKNSVSFATTKLRKARSWS